MAIMSADYLNVAFFIPQMPPTFDAAAPGAMAQQLASEMFGFAAADYNPKYGGSFFGHGKYGYVFEVQVRRVLADTLASKNHPDILRIFD